MVELESWVFPDAEPCVIDTTEELVLGEEVWAPETTDVVALKIALCDSKMVGVLDIEL